MQVNLVSPGRYGDSSGSAREVLLPDLIQFLDPGAAPRTRREQQSEQREERLRRKDADIHAAAAHAAGTPGPAEIAQRAERDMLPGSQAARQEQLRSQTQDAAARDQHGFRQALAEAANRASGESGRAAARPSDQPTKNVKADASAGNGTAGGKPAQAENSESSQAAARPAAAARGGNSPPTVTASGTPPAPNATAATGTAAPRQMSPPNVVATATKVTAVTGVAVAMKAGAPPGVASARPGGPVVAVTSARTGSAGVKAPVGQPARAAPETESKIDANIERILRLIHTRIGKDRSVATLRLDPPELGTLRLRMDLRQDQLSLQVETQTGAAQRLLGEQLDTLRKNLEASGITLERVEIRAPTVANGTTEPNTPQHADVWPGWQEHSARQDTESAGGGSTWESESPPAEPMNVSIGEAVQEPAAESLVNVLA